MRALLTLALLLSLIGSNRASAETCSYLQPKAPNTFSDLPPGVNTGTFTLTIEDAKNLPNPVATIDVYVPKSGQVLNHYEVEPADFKTSLKNDFPINFVQSSNYKSVEFRVCSYVKRKFEFNALSTTFPKNAPFNFKGKRNQNILFPQQGDPDLSGAAKITVNLSHPPHRETSRSGIQLGMNDRPEPVMHPDFLELLTEEGELSENGQAPSPAYIANLVKPLKYGLWRTGIVPNPGGYLEYAHEANVPIVAQIFGLWPNSIDKATNKWKNQALGGPYSSPDNLLKWQSYVQHGLGPQNSFVQFLDLWNEPEISGEAWPIDATPQQLFNTYVAAAHGVTASGLTNTKLGSPGFNKYDRGYFEGLLDYALANGVKVHVLAWHELGVVQDDLSQIKEHLKDAREHLLNNPKYALLKIEEIQINESLSQYNTMIPGAQVGTLFYLEEGKADRADKDGWWDVPHHSKEKMTHDGSMNGLFVPPNEHYPDPATWYQPRVSYWVYRTYADLLDHRIPCKSSNRNIVCFSGALDPETGEAKLLMGYYGTKNTFPNADVQIHLDGVGADLLAEGKMHVKMERIPNEGDKAFTHLPVVFEKNVVTSSAGADLTFPRLANNEAGIITLSRPLLNPPNASSSNSVWKGNITVTRCGDISADNLKGFWAQSGSPGCYTTYIGRARQHPNCQVDSFLWRDEHVYEERSACGKPEEAGFYPNGIRNGRTLYQKAIAP